MWLPLSAAAWTRLQFSFLWQRTGSLPSHERIWTAKYPHTGQQKAPYTCTNRDLSACDKHKHAGSLLKKSPPTHILFAFQWTVTQAFPWLSPGGRSFFMSYHVNHFIPLQKKKLNNLQSSSAPTQTLLTYTQPGLQFISWQSGGSIAPHFHRWKFQVCIERVVTKEQFHIWLKQDEAVDWERTSEPCLFSFAG